MRNDLQEISNEILSIQRSLSDYSGMLLQPSRVFIKKGTLQKMSRKNLTQRMFFLVSIYVLKIVFEMIWYPDDPIPNGIAVVTTLYLTDTSGRVPMSDDKFRISHFN